MRLHSLEQSFLLSRTAQRQVPFVKNAMSFYSHSNRGASSIKYTKSLWNTKKYPSISKNVFFCAWKYIGRLFFFFIYKTDFLKSANSRIIRCQEKMNMKNSNTSPDQRLTVCQHQYQRQTNSTVLVGAFIPRCKPDGSYEDVQCRGSVCYCVDRRGNELRGTAVNIGKGSPLCKTQGKKTANNNLEYKKYNFVYIIERKPWPYMLRVGYSIENV